MSFRGIPEFQVVDLSLSIIGIALWLWVSIIWEDRALILLNGVGLILLTKNMAQYMADNDLLIQIIGFLT